jgi:hypothetical protein
MIERPAARYGQQRQASGNAPGKRRRIAITSTVLALVIGIAIAVIAFARFGAADVTGELGGYRILDSQSVEVTVTVTRDDPSRPVVCIVRARSLDGSETGRREVLVPPSTQKTVQVTTVVVATREPVVGDVYGCGTDVPPYLVAS